jgi:hypothetical protein
MGLSATLREQVDSLLDVGRLLAAQLCEHPSISELYPALLVLEHTVVRATVPLLRTTEREALRRAAAGDRVAAAVVDHCRRHAVEELHDAESMLDDYAALDRDPDEVLLAMPSPTVAAMVGAVYYWVLHFHPAALLGYLVVLEGSPPSPALVEAMRAATGHPDSAFATLAHHAAVDPVHADELWDLLDALPFTAGQLQVLTATALHTADLQATALAELIEDGVRRRMT